MHLFPFYGFLEACSSLGTAVDIFPGVQPVPLPKVVNECPVNLEMVHFSVWFS